MKFFAPRADWAVRTDQNWWGYVSGTPTSSGVRVNPNTAMTFSAVFSATRVISETMASMPIQVLEQEDARTTRKMNQHPAYRLLNMQPNPEQDAMVMIDGGMSFQMNWGNFYAEKQRSSTGQLRALWPIHPSRIPTRNVRRNGTNPEQWQEIEAGQPGEIVYWVNNDNGTATPIPASDMLHIPGVLSQNGITGESIVHWGANSIGIGLATERHAGALFRNGAISNLVLKTNKSVNRDTADRLRVEWQRAFGGADSHYKTLILEDGMEAVPINMDPEATQLILSRQFSVTEVARWYRVPPHMIGDLTRSTFSNIEQQSIDFIVHCIVPWIVRWEKALYRQLLSDEEKQRLIFRFDVTNLLRGDSAARSAYYQAMENMGAMSPNDIREAEHMNPIDGGDVYFIPMNNLFPLDRAGDMADAKIEKLTQMPPAPAKPPEEVDEEDDEEKEDDKEPKDIRVVNGREKRLGFEPILEGIRSEVSRAFAARETQDAERLALREIEARKAAAAARDCLLLSIQATVEGWMGYESRAAKRAAEKPQTFLTWRDEFYPEFKAKLTKALEPFAEAAEPIGFTFDASVAADNYVYQSVTALEALFDVPCSELSGKVNAVSESWAERPKRFAAELLNGGAA